MKAALLLHGYFDSLTDSSSKGIDGLKHIENNILSKISTDVFIHSWQPEIKDFLIELYNPKEIISEPQIDFSNIVNERKLDVDNYWKSIGRPPENKFSYLYSLTEVFKMVKEYEDKTKKYDIIIKGRFDLGRINRNTSGPGLNNPYPVQCINFDPTLDMSKIYAAQWQHIDVGIPDMWWYSNSKNMSKFSNLYETCYNEYMKIGSDYYNTLENKNDVLNVISILKQFFIDNNLWEKICLLETQWE